MNVRVPMRDGVRLATDIYRPDGDGKYPVVLVRTPYGTETPRFSDRGRYFAERGYVFAAQDVRGKYDSEGDWFGSRDEAEDGWDTIEWLAAQPWSSGNIGMLGSSYLGLVQWQVAPLGNPHLKALIPLVAPVTLGRTEENWQKLAVYATGSSALSELSWLTTTDGRVNQNVAPYDWDSVFMHLPLNEIPGMLGRRIPFWDRILRTRTGLWEEWLRCSAAGKWIGELPPLEDHRVLYSRVQVPILQISGWYDGASEHHAYNYKQVRAHSTSNLARKNQWMVMGPWPHGVNRSTKLGDLDFGPEAVIDLDGLYIRWFDRWLKGIDNGIDQEPPVRLFLMGANEWRETDQWPVPGTVTARFYLHSEGNANELDGDGELTLEPPGSEPADVYRYDPGDPTPAATGGDNTEMALDGPVDLRRLEERDDVLVYTSPELARDLEVTGSLWATLYVSSSAPETDFIVRVLDVHPDGASYPVHYTYANPISTFNGNRVGETTDKTAVIELEFELPPTSNLFLKGHRIRVHITSAAFPLFRNLNTGGDPATETRWRVAEQTVFHDRDRSSHVALPVIGSAEGAFK
jgi:putative CocE/NonD family hydrolase